MNEIDKAEHWQAVKAFIIPSFMFFACLLGAAGTFLIREGEMLGWGFIVASAAVLIFAFVATLTFQNKLRAQGLMQDQFDTPAPGFEELNAKTESETSSAAASEPLPESYSALKPAEINAK